MKSRLSVVVQGNFSQPIHTFQWLIVSTWCCKLQPVLNYSVLLFSKTLVTHIYCKFIVKLL